jgi:hypothetical protein
MQHAPTWSNWKFGTSKTQLAFAVSKVGNGPAGGQAISRSCASPQRAKAKNKLDNTKQPFRVLPSDMRKSPLTTGLLVLLCVNVLGTAVLSCWYVQSIRRVRNLQAFVAAATYNRNIVQALANEAAEYAKKNPHMDHLLKSYKSSAPGATTNLIKRAGQ